MPSGHVVFQVQLRKQTGDISRRQANKVLDEMVRVARRNATGGPYSRGNRLARSIKKSRADASGYSASGTVFTDSPHAKVVEHGAPVHDIFPKGAPHVYRFGRGRRPMLKFIWHGTMRYFNQIPGGRGTVGRSHPGMRGKHYMARACLSVAARNRLKVIVFEL